MALVAEGLSLEEALNQTLVQKDNTLETIGQMDDLTELRRKLNITRASKSKTGKADRYDPIIQAYRDRINTLLSGVSDYKDLSALGEKPNSIIQAFVQEKELEVEMALLKLKAPKSVIKSLAGAQPFDTPAILAQELEAIGVLDLYNDRVNRGDSRIKRLNQKFRLING